MTTEKIDESASQDGFDAGDVAGEFEWLERASKDPQVAKTVLRATENLPEPPEDLTPDWATLRNRIERPSALRAVIEKLSGETMEDVGHGRWALLLLLISTSIAAAHSAERLFGGVSAADGSAPRYLFLTLLLVSMVALSALYLGGSATSPRSGRQPPSWTRSFVPGALLGAIAAMVLILVPTTTILGPRTAADALSLLVRVDSATAKDDTLEDLRREYLSSGKDLPAWTRHLATSVAVVEQQGKGMRVCVPITEQDALYLTGLKPRPDSSYGIRERLHRRDG